MANEEGSPAAGASLHGVTGKEQTFAFSVASDPSVTTDATEKSFPYQNPI